MPITVIEGSVTILEALESYEPIQPKRICVIAQDPYFTRKIKSKVIPFDVDGDVKNSKAPNVVFYDPYFRSKDTNKWWDRIPEIIYPAVQVNCETNLGRITLQDYLRITIAGEIGLPNQRKGWEHEVENQLRIQKI